MKKDFKLIDLENQILNANSIIDEMVKHYNEKEDIIFSESLRIYAKPPIKGKITKGKIKWRGIKLYQTTLELGKPVERWLMQRGKQISPKITFDFKNDMFYGINQK